MKPPDRQSKRFLATIYKIWMLQSVDVPKEIGHALQKVYASEGSAARKEKSERGKYIPVVAIVNGRSTRTTLTPAGGGITGCSSMRPCGRRRGRTWAT